MKNFIQRETMNFTGYDLESYCRFIALSSRYLSAGRGRAGIGTEIPYAALPAPLWHSRRPARNAPASIELIRAEGVPTAEAKSGIAGFRLLRLNGSAFHGFVRDQYTTLPDIKDRPLHMWLDLDWTYVSEPAAFSGAR
jgi:urate oxidase/2-oxo-4-hydroxy-4-carboxy-5-ureidoimidazoline decarboxylase